MRAAPLGREPRALAIRLACAIIAISILCFDHWSRARAAEVLNFNDRGGQDLSLTLGRFLPFNIVGVRDNYPMWGFHWSHPTQASRVEYGMHFIKANGVTFYHASVGSRVDFDLVGTVEGFLTFGFDLAYYQRMSDNVTSEFPYYFSGGAHLGFGGYYNIGKDWAVRADFKSNFGPGRSLYTGIGLLYRFGGGEKTEGAP